MLFLEAIGWWRFVNQPESMAVFSSALAMNCFALLRTDTSKLFERLDLMLQLLCRRSGVSNSIEGVLRTGVTGAMLRLWLDVVGVFGIAPLHGVVEVVVGVLASGVLVAVSDSAVMSLVVGVGISSYSLISVADEVSVDRRPIRSVLVHTMPAFSLRPNEATELGMEGDTREGISEARR